MWSSSNDDNVSIYILFLQKSRSPCIIPAVFPVTDPLWPRGETSQIPCRWWCRFFDRCSRVVARWVVLCTTSACPSDLCVEFPSSCLRLIFNVSTMNIGNVWRRKGIRAVRLLRRWVRSVRQASPGRRSALHYCAPGDLRCWYGTQRRQVFFRK